MIRCSFAVFALVISITLAAGQEKDIQPTLVICGGGQLPDVVFKNFLAAAGSSPSLVYVPTASQRQPDVDAIKELWAERGFDDVRVLHSDDRAVTSQEAFADPLKTATAVWFGGGSQQRIADAYVDTPIEEELAKLIARGGVIGGTSAGAAIQTRVMIASGRQTPKMSTGLDLLSRSIVDQHFLKRNRVPRLIAAVRMHPELTGYGIDEGTAVIVRQGSAEVVGRSYVLRIRQSGGQLEVQAYGNGDQIPLAD